MCNADSTGGITIGNVEDGGSYEWRDGSQDYANERQIYVNGYKWGPVVFLTLELTPWDIAVGPGKDFINTTSVTGRLPVPIGNASGVAYYGNRAIIATLWGDSSSLHLRVRNVSAPDVADVVVDTDPINISIMYMTNET